MSWLDQYEIRARIAPTLIVCFPLIVTLLFTMLGLSDSVAQFLSSGVVLLLFVYALSFLVAHLGRRKQKDLWNQWNGAPATRMIRWRDDTLDSQLKQRIREAVEEMCGVQLATEDDEESDPSRAEEKIAQSFKQVREIVRQNDQNGLWSKHNAEYGFQRNLYGGWWVWLFLSVAGTAASVLAWFSFGIPEAAVSGVLNVTSLTISLVWRRLLPTFTREAAESYAQSVWASFLEIYRRQERRV